MNKTQTILILIYTLAMAPGCRTHSKQSDAKEIPSTKWSEGFAEDDKEAQDIFNDFIHTAGDMGLLGEIPLVVINRQTLRKRTPNDREVIGTQKLARGEELYYGSKDSRYVVSMTVRGVDKAKFLKDRKLNLIIAKLDTGSDVREGGQFQKVNGKKLTIDLNYAGDKETLRKSIADQFQEINSILQSVSLTDEYYSGGKKALEDMRSERETLQSRNVNLDNKILLTPVGLIAGIAAIILVFVGFARYGLKPMGRAILIALGALCGFIAYALIQHVETSVRPEYQENKQRLKLLQGRITRMTNQYAHIE